VVNAKCDTRSPIIVAFRPPRDANAMDPHNQPKCKGQYVPLGSFSRLRSAPPVSDYADEPVFTELLHRGSGHSERQVT
jgi:hypothetical protein